VRGEADLERRVLFWKDENIPLHRLSRIFANISCVWVSVWRFESLRLIRSTRGNANRFLSAKLAAFFLCLVLLVSWSTISNLPASFSLYFCTLFWRFYSHLTQSRIFCLSVRFGFHLKSPCTFPVLKLDLSAAVVVSRCWWCGVDPVDISRPDVELTSPLWTGSVILVDLDPWMLVIRWIWKWPPILLDPLFTGLLVLLIFCRYGVGSNDSDAVIFSHWRSILLCFVIVCIFAVSVLQWWQFRDRFPGWSLCLWRLRIWWITLTTL
jgi:hypothetical protein